MFGFSQRMFERKESSRKMTKTRVSMFAGLAAALLIGLPTAAFAADGNLSANLDGTRNDEQAMGGAQWFSEGEGRHTTLKVRVAHVSTTELATVYVNGRFVGVIDISRGAGTLNLDTRDGERRVPIVEQGSTIKVYGEDDAPILVGTFRQG